MLLSVGVIRDLEILQFLLHLARREKCVLGYVIAVAKCRLRVHHVAEEVMVWETFGCELQVTIFPLLQSRLEAGSIVKVFLPQLEDLQTSRQIAKLQHRRVVESEVMRPTLHTLWLHEVAFDFEDFHTAAPWARCSVVLEEARLVGEADGYIVLASSIGEETLRKMI